MLRPTVMNDKIPRRMRSPRWITVLVGSAIAGTVALAAFSGALMLAIRFEDVRLTFMVGVACGAALLALRGRWRWLVLAWWVGLAAFASILFMMASAPNYGDLLAK